MNYLFHCARCDYKSNSIKDMFEHLRTYITEEDITKAIEE